MYPGLAGSGFYRRQENTSERLSALNTRTILRGATPMVRTLYLTAQTGLYRIRLNIPGTRPFAGLTN